MSLRRVVPWPSLAVAVLCAATALSALPAEATAQDASRAVRVFFDCNADCDGDYVRTETPWVAFVRDRTDADVHLLITSLGTGAGGEQYTLNFVGLGAFAARDDTLTYVFNVGGTEDNRRRGLTRTIQLGLAPYVARSPLALAVRMVLDDDASGAAPTAVASADPWRSWVFDLDANASFDGEERQSELEWGGSFEATRITPRWKFGVGTDAFFDESHFTLDDSDGDGVDEKITTLRESYGAGAVAVRSHGAHWGSGFQVSVGRSTFENTKLAVRAAPAVEYSVFPYDEFTRRQLTLQYSVGVSSFRYREETIFNKFAETRPTHALVVGYDLTQPWGEADVTLETFSYLDNSSQWRMNFDGELEVRVARGFAIEIGGGASLLRDQLAIPKRGATPEEILLELRDLQTNYRYDGRLGLSYTFGSIFNTVVNPRFGTGPGSVLR
ncbi:MAG: hypothetical protein WD801_12045 [Gemmatimonadaceae bacterium]